MLVRAVAFVRSAAASLGVPARRRRRRMAVSCADEAYRLRDASHRSAPRAWQCSSADVQSEAILPIQRGAR
jgi:hypothetical protein